MEALDMAFDQFAGCIEDAVAEADDALAWAARAAGSTTVRGSDIRLTHRGCDGTGRVSLEPKWLRMLLLMMAMTMTMTIRTMTLTAS